MKALAERMTAYSMMPAPWLVELYELAELVKNIPGAVVECGVYNGGSAVMLAIGAGLPRQVWLFDSWAGLPEPGSHDGPRAAQRWNQLDGKMNVGTLQKTQEAFSGLDCSLHLRPGWFEQTIPESQAEIGDIALLHIDSDWFKSVKLALELSRQVVKGGLVIVHDYWAWPGTHLAVNQFLGKNTSKLKRVAKVGCWWQKTS